MHEGMTLSTVYARIDLTLNNSTLVITGGGQSRPRFKRWVNSVARTRNRLSNQRYRCFATRLFKRLSEEPPGVLTEGVVGVRDNDVVDNVIDHSEYEGCAHLPIVERCAKVISQTPLLNDAVVACVGVEPDRARFVRDCLQHRDRDGARTGPTSASTLASTSNSRAAEIFSRCQPPYPAIRTQLPDRLSLPLLIDVHFQAVYGTVSQ